MYYSSLIGRLMAEIVKKRSYLKKKVLLSIKIVHYLTLQHGKNSWISVRIDWSPTYSLDLVPSDFFLFQSLARRAKIFIERTCHRIRKSIFCRARRQILNKLKEWEHRWEVYRLKRRLHWKIKLNLTKNTCYFC